MKRISELLGRIIGIQSSEALVLIAVQQALKKQFALEVPLGSISRKGSSITLKGIDQSARSALFIKKESVLKEINITQSVRIIRDIR
jgi:hypothetical protein